MRGACRQPAEIPRYVGGERETGFEPATACLVKMNCTTGLLSLQLGVPVWSEVDDRGGKGCITIRELRNCEEH